MVKDNKAKRTRTAVEDVVTREYTINLHKRLHGVGFKRRAPRACDEIRKFAQKMMGTKDVRLTVDTNRHIWSKGVRNVPFRIRVQLQRKRNQDEESAEKLYTLVEVVETKEFKGLQNVTVAN
ncbi:ribosomal protein L31 [Capsaspora owczarzaki ATCC 30864]|uniref:Ribosomal protein L31 n=1 Tax=Capsaspora owczarzaki (strain ATCC 30864) TaxID=595528 RepID=A0A0D2VXZ9_CAPO3|nr:ribosomal protein L31 [Capsaspora owczarzaki ATCC 30864]KJE96547.1 ribosomal protein L31 [Capsaspora owczarzaki ATCC 30864]|eukprot:XP_004344474.2 ribosomal protein L31 [Capsaspora owczarzaki ATCC 30864]